MEKLRSLIILIIVLIGSNELNAGINLIVDLSGTWKFRLGDHITWRHVYYNDEQWDTIAVPCPWKSQGYDHNGYAWYRKTFTFPEEPIGNQLILIVGKIDEADQTFLNGQLIGSTGAFPPETKSERETLRIYDIPTDLLGEENVIAIRVYNIKHDGGIYKGPVGIVHKDAQEVKLFEYFISME